MDTHVLDERGFQSGAVVTAKALIRFLPLMNIHVTPHCQLGGKFSVNTKNCFLVCDLVNQHLCVH